MSVIKSGLSGLQRWLFLGRQSLSRKIWALLLYLSWVLLQQVVIGYRRKVIEFEIVYVHTGNLSQSAVLM